MRKMPVRDRTRYGSLIDLFLPPVLGQFIENQLPEDVTLQTFMEDLLKMPSEYVDQVMYSVQIQQEQREESQASLKDKKRDHAVAHSPQQRARSNMTTTTTRSTTSNSHHS